MGKAPYLKLLFSTLFNVAVVVVVVVVGKRRRRNK
jgi:hypothetical protein